jgi:hypothetical protein
MTDDKKELWLSIVAKSLAMIALKNEEVGKGLGDRATFLEGLGLPRAVVAEMLGSTVNSLGNLARTKKGAARGKSKRH